MEIETNLDEGLRELPAKGFIRFSIKAEDTKENESVHNGFKEFCKIETDNNFTQGLRKLLEYYQQDFKISLLWDVIKSLEMRIEEFEKKLANKENKKENDNEVF